ncbi:NADP-dependent oxidoreductase domain-containing protein [Aspergillus venezuelensis]
MSLGRFFKLNSGYRIPAIGLGTWLSKPHEVESAVESALRAGYRHIDAAACYLNENETLKDLQTDYLDLYPIHWPVTFEHTNETLTPVDPVSKRFRSANVPMADTWKVLEKLVKAGKVKSIGTAEIPPAVNQIEAHPYLQQAKLTQYSKDKNILTIAADLQKDPAAVLISWTVQRGTAVLPKSVTPSRIKSNFQDFVIPDSEFEDLNKLDKNQRYNYLSRWGIDVFGELGAEEAERRAEEYAAGLRAAT